VSKINFLSVDPKGTTCPEDAFHYDQVQGVLSVIVSVPKHKPRGKNCSYSYKPKKFPINNLTGCSQVINIKFFLKDVTCNRVRKKFFRFEISLIDRPDISFFEYENQDRTAIVPQYSVDSVKEVISLLREALPVIGTNEESKLAKRNDCSELTYLTMQAFSRAMRDFCRKNSLNFFFPATRIGKGLYRVSWGRALFNKPSRDLFGFLNLWTVCSFLNGKDTQENFEEMKTILNYEGWTEFVPKPTQEKLVVI
jgi:hypothetical protein